MGDGTQYNNQVQVSHSYNTPGNCTVTLSSSNDNCRATATQDISEEALSTGIANSKAKQIQVYANQNEIYISQNMNKEELSVSIAIYNSLGQQSEGETQTID